MKLTKSDVDHTAWLARLELSDDEKDRLMGDLNRIMDYFEKLQQLDTDNVEPTSHSIPVVNVFRDDAASKSFSQADAISNAPEETNGYFVVPQVVET